MAEATAGSDVPYSALPLDPIGPPGNAWGRFGESDELGTLNLLTPAVVAAAATEIVTGERVVLDLPLNQFPVPLFHREPFEWKLKNWEPRGSPTTNDDVLTFNTQSSSQWDGLRHYGHKLHERFYNGRTQKDLESSKILGIDVWVKHGGIVGRGVLIDYHDWAARHHVHRPPFESVGIPVADLQAAAAEQGVAFRPGDILFVRSGFGAAYFDLGAAAQKALADRPSVDMIGVARSAELLRWLWENRFAAVAGDAVGFEQSPPQATGPEADVCLHNVLLSGWGMPIGELFDLEELARVCKRLKRMSFFVSSVPLNVPGGVASPPNAVAIF